MPPPAAPNPQQAANRALVLGLLSLVFVVVCSVPAIVFGVKGLRRARSVGGEGRSWTGLVLGVLTLAFGSWLTYVGVTSVVRGIRDEVGKPAGVRAAENAIDYRTALLESEVNYAVLEPPSYGRGSTRCDEVVSQDRGSTVNCKVEGKTYVVTFGADDSFTVEAR